MKYPTPDTVIQMIRVFEKNRHQWDFDEIDYLSRCMKKWNPDSFELNYELGRGSPFLFNWYLTQRDSVYAAVYWCIHSTDT